MNLVFNIYSIYSYTSHHCDTDVITRHQDQHFFNQLSSHWAFNSTADQPFINLTPDIFSTSFHHCWAFNSTDRPTILTTRYNIIFFNQLLSPLGIQFNSLPFSHHFINSTPDIFFNQLSSPLGIQFETRY